MSKHKRTRIPGMVTHRNHQLGGAIMNNPAWTQDDLERAASGDITPNCHDGSPSMDFACSSCGAASHLHLSQLDGAPDDAEVGGRCHACGAEVDWGLTVGGIRSQLLDAFGMT